MHRIETLLSKLSLGSRVEPERATPLEQATADDPPALPQYTLPSELYVQRTPTDRKASQTHIFFLSFYQLAEDVRTRVPKEEADELGSVSSTPS